ncbi:hypothetical protein NA57DRAFT_67423 [Rhizodiscina lignyota]|uniref:Ribosomal protein bL31m N-terminal domain-containing protein n=1 Tax=Rhizodiscina lignyota TaxID=1504668 RepID=A0A9P4M3L2_9PEZI|nr:hypothetical protein NA57DRAFT_67423 [Rhizodiscina lignyota]
MASPSLSISLKRPICPQCLRLTSPSSPSHQQTRHATLIKRPRRPYTFTQLVTLSDGSAYLQRTTSPAPVYRSTKDTRNTALWNPSSQKLMNVEEDEAGRLRAFRAKFGRGWDAEAVNARDGEEALPRDAPEDSLLDLITGFGKRENSKEKAKGSNEPAAKSGKGKGGMK